MRRLALACVLLFQTAALAASNDDAKTERILSQLDPDARFEQVCDLEAMKHISKDKTYRPERTIVSALAAPKVVATTMTGTGGAFRSKGKWYQFAFRCETTADHMKVQTFSFQIGAPIPEEQWEPNGLW